MNSSTKNNQQSIAVEFAFATVTDLDALLAIENQSFHYPWPRQHFEGELNQPHSFTLLARPQESPAGEVAGYIIYWLVVDEMHILNVAVAPRWRRQGIGRALLQEAIRLAQKRAMKTAWLEVRPSNRSALSLYRSFGFNLVMTRKRYYDETGEDALILSRLL